MPTPPTQKGQIDSILQLTGATEFTAAQTIIEGWQAAADNATQLAAWHQQLFALFGTDVKDQAGLVAAISGLNANISEFFATLGVNDHAPAMARLKVLVSNEGLLKPLQAGFDSVRTTLKLPETATFTDIVSAVADFETRVGNEVIARAAAAGIKAPIDLKPGAEGNVKVMARSAFDLLSAGDRMAFMQGGGTLTD